MGAQLEEQLATKPAANAPRVEIRLPASLPPSPSIEPDFRRDVQELQKLYGARSPLEVNAASPEAFLTSVQSELQSAEEVRALLGVKLRAQMQLTERIQAEQSPRALGPKRPEFMVSQSRNNQLETVQEIADVSSAVQGASLALRAGRPSEAAYLSQVLELRTGKNLAAWQEEAGRYRELSGRELVTLGIEAASLAGAPIETARTVGGAISESVARRETLPQFAGRLMGSELPMSVAEDLFSLEFKFPLAVAAAVRGVNRIDGVLRIGSKYAPNLWRGDTVEKIARSLDQAVADGLRKPPHVGIPSTELLKESAGDWVNGHISRMHELLETHRMDLDALAALNPKEAMGVRRRYSALMRKHGDHLFDVAKAQMPTDPKEAEKFVNGIREGVEARLSNSSSRSARAQKILADSTASEHLRAVSRLELPRTHLEQELLVHLRSRIDQLK